MTRFATTDDVFLKGRLTIQQPKNGFRSGSDAVLLAAAAASFGFEQALDAGCGAGAALLSLQEVTTGHGVLTGMDIDPALVDLAQQNVEMNQCIERVNVRLGNVLSPPPDLLDRFDLVLSNPPYFDNDRAIRDPAPQRLTAHLLGAPLSAWIDGLLAMTARKGRIVLVHRSERLGDILCALEGKAGDIAICPVRARAGQMAKRVLVSAKKGSKSPLRLLAGIELHDARNPRGFSDAYEAICDGGILPM